VFRILDRYVIREITVPFVISLLISTFILVVPTVLRQGEDLLAKGVEWSIIVEALVSLLPHALAITIPISLLMGILIGFGRMSSDREFVALQACGVGIVRLLKPIGVLTVLATAATAYETIVALPDANQRFREITYDVGASRVERNLTPRVFFEDFGNLIFFVNEVPQTGGWRRVFLADRRTAGKTMVHFANEGRIHLDREKQLVQLELKGVSSVTSYAAKPDEAQHDELERFVLTMDPKLVFKDPPARGPNEMTLDELRASITNANKQGDPGNVFRIAYQQKWAIPVACPILAVLGLALGTSNRRDGNLGSFALGFGVIFAYYMLMFSFRPLAMSGRFNADWAMWMPDIIMGVAAVGLLAWRVRSAEGLIRITLPRPWPRRTAHPEAADSSRVRTSRRVVLVVRLPHFRVPRPRMLDLYVAREYFRIVLLAFVSLLGIFYITTFIDIADNIGRVSITTILRFFYYQTPQFVFYVLPMTVLVSTLVTIGIMTKNNELIIMRACGVSLYRTAFPVVLFGAVVGGMLFFLQERVLPGANREADRLNRIIRGLPPQTSPFNQRWIVSRSGDFYHYDSFEVAKNRFENLWLYDVDEKAWRLQGMTYAKTVELPDTIGMDEQTLVTWTARQGWTRAFTTPVEYGPFSAQPLAIEAPEYFASKPNDTDQMTFDEMLTYAELREYVEQLKASGSDDVGRYLVALQRKIAFPFVSVIMTLIAVPFAATVGRRGALYGIGVGIVLAITYFLTMSILGAFGAGGLLPVTLAAWAPNLLFSLLALYLILTVRT
jgi:LPS export ABC transporter permease LptG/LPS export ABC transporter permease LptF